MEKTLSAGFSLPDFCDGFLKGRHTHFGLWPDEKTQLSLDEAQQNMFRHLLSFFPPTPATVLLLGCRIGNPSSLLAEMGYDVTAACPSAAVTENTKKKYSDMRITLITFESFCGEQSTFPGRHYDVIVVLESLQYLGPPDCVIRKARELLKERGLALLAGEVCGDKKTQEETGLPRSSDLIVALSENGLRIIGREELGARAFPTYESILREIAPYAVSHTSGGPNTLEDLSPFFRDWTRRRECYSGGKLDYAIFVARNDPFSVRIYSPGDEHSILDMFNKIFGANRTLDHWYWKFRDDPYGSFRISLTFSKAGLLVAQYAGYPVPFYSAIDLPEEFISYQIGDTMTSPSVRNIGLGRTGILARTADHFYEKFCRDEVPFIYGFNTGTHRALGMRYLGYQFIDPVNLWAGDISMLGGRRLQSLRALLSGYSVQEVSTITDEWDTFFDRVSREYRFLVRRDAKYLRWRYLDCPDKTHRIFAVRKRGRLAGWGVFARKENRLIWGDALFDKKHPQAARFLFQHLSDKVFPDCDTIEGWFSTHPAWWRRQLEELAFKKTPEPNNLEPCFVVFGDTSLLQTLRDHYYYTMGDSDLF